MEKTKLIITNNIEEIQKITKALEKINLSIYFKSVSWLICSMVDILVTDILNNRKIDENYLNHLSEEYVERIFNLNLSEEEHIVVSNLFYRLIENLYTHYFILNDINKHNVSNVVQWSIFNGKNAILKFVK